MVSPEIQQSQVKVLFFITKALQNIPQYRRLDQVSTKVRCFFFLDKIVTFKQNAEFRIQKLHAHQY